MSTTTDAMDHAVAYLRQFTEALAPTAKKLYEAGLVTIQVDAAQQIVLCTFGLVACILLLRKCIKDYKQAKIDAAAKLASLPEHKQDYPSLYDATVGDMLILGGFVHFGLALAACMIAFSCSINLVNLWVWTKLFRPELWIIHQAIEKVVS